MSANGVSVGIRAEFVVAAAHVLNKSVSGTDHSGRASLVTLSSLKQFHQVLSAKHICRFDG
jgi:hypothetical protein